MRMNFGEVLTIEDLGNHSAATVIELGILLAGTVNVTPDLKRKHFYEIEDERTVYYIHVSPATGTIFFLATWENLRASSFPTHQRHTTHAQSPTQSRTPKTPPESGIVNTEALLTQSLATHQERAMSIK